MDGVDIREIPGEGLQLVLYAEGQESGRASVRDDVLDDLKKTLGVTRDQVVAELQGALRQLHQGQLEKVQLDRLEERPRDSGYFIAVYIFRDYRRITEGLVWYDVRKGETGPSDVPALVRNKLRFEVHAKLVGDDPKVEALRKALR